MRETDMAVPATCPAAWQVAPYYKVDATDLMAINPAACTTCKASAGVAWDGQFGSGPTAACSWLVYTTASGPNLGGKELFASGSDVKLVPSTKWTLVIKCAPQNPAGIAKVIWQGDKTDGDTPAGTYTRTGGCSTAPATLTLEPACPLTDPGHSWCGADKAIADLVGGGVTITTREPRLRCELDTEWYFALSAAFINVSNSSTGDWAETGFAKGNSPWANINDLHWGVFFEVSCGPNLATDYWFRFGASPPGAGAHDYHILLDPAAGKWTATYGGNTWVGSDFTHSDWTNELGTAVHYEGEVTDQEHDMPGTAASHCVFSNCKYRVQGQAQDQAAGLVAANLFSTDRTEWDYQYNNGTGFEIWDVNPIT
jgi:hypothetical protein